MTPEGNWKLDRQEKVNYAISEYYFGYFLAIQNAYVYELADPAIHPKITEWIENNDSVLCSTKPFATGGQNKLTVLCECQFVIFDISSHLDEKKGYYVVDGFSKLSCVNY